MDRSLPLAEPGQDAGKVAAGLLRVALDRTRALNQAAEETEGYPGTETVADHTVLQTV